jgi:hypothetical protein
MDLVTDRLILERVCEMMLANTDYDLLVGELASRYTGATKRDRPQ